MPGEDANRMDVAGDRHPVSQILQRILRDLQTIFHNEVELAAGEVQEKARRSAKAGVLLAAAGFLAFLAGECMITTFIAALNIVLPLWLSALLMGVMCAIGAGGAFVLGRLSLEEVDVLPQKTLETVKDNIDWAKNRAS
jgi:Putative Actinobacterial Holin-X, holin superfamily III